MLKLVTGLSAAFLFAGVANAEDQPAPPEQPAAPAAVADAAPPPQEVKVVPPAKKICKSITRAGSRVDVIRACLTKEEWDDLRARHRDGMDELLRAHDNPNPG